MPYWYKERRKNQSKELYELLCGGMTDEEARDILEVSDTTFDNIKKTMWQTKAEELRARPMEHVYLEYVASQKACIADLDDHLRQVDAAKAPASVTSIIKAKSDIYDKIIKTGQDFGFVAKKPEERRVIGGVVITQMSNDQLREAITGELASVTRMVTQHGEGSIMDMDPGQLHYDEAKGPRALPAPQKPVMEKKVPRGNTQKAKANNTHKGRRVVKQPTLG